MSAEEKGQAANLPATPDAVLRVMERMSRWTAHRLNNPLATISGSAQLLERSLAAEGLSEDPCAGYARAIREEAERCSRLLNEVALLCAEPVPEPRDTDITQVLEAALSAAMAASNPQNTRVVRDYSQTLPRVAVDPELLGQAFEALLVNALEAMPEGGELRLAASPLEGRDGAVQITIEDTGEGFDPEEAATLVEPFVSSRPRHPGLGLTLACRALGLHKAQVSLHSRGKGQGARVSIQLPAT